ncbi:MAG: hypothetical protein Q9178_005793 [Gyalolechia marmorata]
MEQRGFPFLSLPPEIRHCIYNELLISRPNDSPDAPVLLWHDRKGRDNSLSIYPQILRVSRQVNAEATPLLYDCNVFSFELTTPEGQSCIARIINKSQALLLDDSGKRMKYFQQPGLLSPSCLRRLAHIEIIISALSVWTNGRGFDFWSSIGEIFIEILRLLADDQEVSETSPKKKKLLITVQKEISDGYGWLLFPRLREARRGALQMGLRNSNRETKGQKQMADKVCPLVEAVAKRRDVSIYEVLKESKSSGVPGDPRVSRTITREVLLHDFGDL